MKKTVQHLIETIESVKPLLLTISDEDAAFKPYPAKWSKKEIIGHLIDSAGNNQQKFVRTLLAENGHLDFVGYKQNDWVAVQNYQRADWAKLISIWEAYNFQIAHVIACADEAKLLNTISIEGSEPFTLAFIMPDYVEHLKHHLKSILPLAGLMSTFSNIYNA